MNKAQTMLLSEFPPEIIAKIFKDAGLNLTGMRVSKHMADQAEENCAKSIEDTHFEFAEGLCKWTASARPECGQREHS